jgi:hypothetical protein
MASLDASKLFWLRELALLRRHQTKRTVRRSGPGKPYEGPSGANPGGTGWILPQERRPYETPSEAIPPGRNVTQGPQRIESGDQGNIGVKAIQRPD